jgi:hypothetical protein
MKMLYLEYRESMHAFFSKKGIPWHGTLFIRNKRPEEYDTLNMNPLKINNFQSDKTITFVDSIVEGATEDGHAVSSILERNIGEYKIRNPAVEEAILMTDGAGCYSGVYLFAFLPLVHTMTGIKIIRHYISEAGQGKTLLDTHFSYSIRHVHTSVCSGKGDNNITSGDDCVRALQQRGGVAHSLAEALTFGSNNKNYEVLKFENLTSFSHREYSYNDAGQCTVSLYHINNRGIPTIVEPVRLQRLWKNGRSPVSLGAHISLGSVVQHDIKQQRKSSGDMAVSNEDKSKKKRIRDNKAAVKLTEQEDQAKVIRELNVIRLKYSGMYTCPKCRNLYIIKHYYDSHVNQCEEPLPARQGFRNSIIHLVQTNT